MAIWNVLCFQKFCVVCFNFVWINDLIQNYYKKNCGIQMNALTFLNLINLLKHNQLKMNNSFYFKAKMLAPLQRFTVKIKTRKNKSVIFHKNIYSFISQVSPTFLSTSNWSFSDEFRRSLIPLQTKLCSKSGKVLTHTNICYIFTHFGYNHFFLEDFHGVIFSRCFFLHQNHLPKSAFPQQFEVFEVVHSLKHTSAVSHKHLTSDPWPDATAETWAWGFMWTRRKK